MSVLDTERDFSEFVSSHEPVLRGIVARRLRDSPADVEDALQEGLVRIWREFPSFPRDPERRRAYAGQILHRASTEHVRRRWGRHLDGRRREVFVDFGAPDRHGIEDPESGTRELTRLLARMHDEVDTDARDAGELQRRIEALRQMLPALKPLERAVLLASHPAGGNRRAPDVAKRLGISPSQVRQLYMEAMATLRPLLAHALAPELDAEEAGRVLDYAAGTMTDKRQRGRMKRHLKHCEACRTLAHGQRAVIGTGAHLMLPLPGLLGLVQAAAGGTAVGATALAGGGAGAGVATGGTALGGLALKAVAGAAALTAAAGGYSAVEHKGVHPPRHVRQVAEETVATATPEPTLAQTAAPTVTEAATAAPARAPDKPSTSSRPTPTPSPEPATGPTDPAPEATAPQSTEAMATPPPQKTSTKTAKSFAQEFGP